MLHVMSVPSEWTGSLEIKDDFFSQLVFSLEFEQTWSSRCVSLLLCSTWQKNCYWMLCAAFWKTF